MGYRDTEQLIEAYLDGELSVEQAAEVESLVRGNAELRRQYGPVIRLLRSPEPVAMPDDLTERVLSSIQGHILREKAIPVCPGRPTLRGYRVWLPWAPALAASFLLFMAGWFGSQLTSRSSTQRVDPKPNLVPQVSVVASPLLLNSLAQSLTASGPANPAAFVMQGAAMEVIAAASLETAEDLAVVPVRQTPRRLRGASRSEDRSSEPTDGPRLPVFVPIQRL
ncbi:MAG TPA: hypothetical protein PKY77_17970 [Phycisphaerae bacterium]|nr:hypothetical protein [Phycisphaerae bacterium]HRY70260.1 hypothetical protein [Phycisphaerae bacterium]HSA27569.1 hypothetical protein [Phycisphaerae bacterium]